MLHICSRYAPALALLLTIFFFAGSVVSTAVAADQNRPSQCCENDAPPQVPVTDGECADCRCLTCSAILYLYTPLSSLTGPKPLPVLPRAIAVHPSEYIYSIDYPPERV